MKLSKTKKKIFNSDDTKLMNDFYQQNKYPQKEDFTEIENLTEKTKNKFENGLKIDVLVKKINDLKLLNFNY